MFCSTTQTEKRKSKWNVEMNLIFSNGGFITREFPRMQKLCQNYRMGTCSPMEQNRQYTFNCSEPCRLSFFNFKYLTLPHMTQVSSHQYDLKKKKKKKQIETIVKRRFKRHQSSPLWFAAQARASAAATAPSTELKKRKERGCVSLKP